MPDYMKLYMELHESVAVLNNEMVSISKKGKVRDLILKQRDAIRKSEQDYLTQMQQERKAAGLV